LAGLCDAAKCVSRLERRPVELVGLVADGVDSWRPAFEAAGIWLSGRLPDDPIWLEGDRERLARVLDNLLTNAVKYTGPAGHVMVSVDCRDGEAALRVRDTGIGISADFLPRVFDPFARDDNPFVRSQPGSGIGLLAVRRIVEQHGGRVDVTSPGPGRGSEFTVRLPASRRTPQSPTADGTPALAAATDSRIAL
jgi:signal transduction histidine kinase